MLFILFGLTIYYIVKKGVDFFFLAAMSCLLYFYPLVFFDNIVFLAEGINSVGVFPAARFSIIAGIVYLLIVGLSTARLRIPQPDATAVRGHYMNLQSRSVAIAVIGLMLVMVQQNGLGLNGRDKTELMANMGYLYKTLTLLTGILAAYAFILKDRLSLVVASASVFLSLMYGFRGDLAILISAFFLTRPGKPGWKNVYYILGGGLAVALMIISKETGYFTRDLSAVFTGFADSFGSDGWDFLSIANPESASISAVYNEVVKHDFSVTVGYLFDSVAALFPFTNLFGFEAVGFDTYFKGVLFGSEGDSFASGMFSVGYAEAGYLGVAICFWLIARLGRTHARLMRSGTVIQRVLVVAVAGVVLTSFYRSDLIYLVGIVRSLVVIVVVLKLISSAARFYTRPRVDMADHGV